MTEYQVEIVFRTVVTIMVEAVDPHDAIQETRTRLGQYDGVITHINVKDADGEETLYTESIEGGHPDDDDPALRYATGKLD